MDVSSRGAASPRSQEDRITPMTDDNLPDDKLPGWLVDPPAMRVVDRRERPPMSAEGMVIIGTSGSTDYLTDPNADKRFWPVTAPDYSLACDGLHDEEAPVQYLCSACFPRLRGDLSEPQDELADEDRRDEREEME
jgi:hypothetical protein